MVFEWVALSSVVEGRYAAPHLLLDVALLEVLLHFGGHPLEVHDCALAWVAVIGGVHTHVQDHLFVLCCVFRELLGRDSAFKRHDDFVMPSNITAENHLDNDLANVPVLSFGEKLENVVLGVKEKFEGDGAVMVLQDRFDIVSDRLLMLDSD